MIYGRSHDMRTVIEMMIIVLLVPELMEWCPTFTWGGAANVNANYISD
jgi:hypothetical protein